MFMTLPRSMTSLRAALEALVFGLPGTRPAGRGWLVAGLVACAVGVLAAVPPAAAADTDWPQFGGPKRDNRSASEGLAREWPESGPPLLGTARNLGIGYASVAVADGAVLTMGSRGDDELVICLDEQTLTERWATKIGATRPDGMGAGPRGTPTIAGDAVYALGANGDLACLALADGRVRWAGNVLANSGGSNITWGISESPLVDGGRVIVTPGGPGATMVAVDAKSGRLVWKATVPGNPAAAYSSIIVVETGGLKQYVNFVHTGVIGVRADTGQFLWGNDASANGTANCSSPVAWQGNVFSASGYGKGGALVRLAGDRRGVAATLAYATKDLKSHHGGLVVDGDYVYGTDEGLLTCLDLRTGRVTWQNRSVGKGALVWADGLLVLRSEDGPVALVECSPRGYVEKGRFTPADRSDRPAWPHPVIANGKLWLRDQEGMGVYGVGR